MRRRFLPYLTAAALGVGTAMGVTACGDDETTTETVTVPQEAPGGAGGDGEAGGGTTGEATVIQPTETTDTTPTETTGTDEDDRGEDE